VLSLVEPLRVQALDGYLPRSEAGGVVLREPLPRQHEKVDVDIHVAVHGGERGGKEPVAYEVRKPRLEEPSTYPAPRQPLAPARLEEVGGLVHVLDQEMGG
jgi:hypothetical protein